MKRLIPLLLIMAAAFGIVFYINAKNSAKKQKVRYLQYYGDREVTPEGDTLFHSVGEFSFKNQLGETITDQSVAGKNYVVEYFFTTCKSICPIMNGNMMKVADKIKGDNSFKILSHTVKPEQDSVPVMLQYAKAHNADNSQWYFLTGSKRELYDMARYSYLLNTDTTITQPIEDDFIHTQYFVLVDKERHLRGFYDGTSKEEVAKLLNDIDLLRKEQEENAKK